MSSLSEEILKLSELHASGILSHEEFKAAKEAAINRFAVPQMSPAEDGRDHTREVKPHIPFSHVDISGFDEGTAGHLDREKAYGLLETILRNLQLYPTEKKYRRLRLGNSMLQSQLFSVPGAMTFLRSLGFVVQGEANGEESMWLPEEPRRDLLNAALDAINFLRSREREAQTHTCNYTRFRHNISLAVRRERWENAKAVGELRTYIVQEFCADDAGDGLLTSSSNLEQLRNILVNILHHPTEGKYRRLRLQNGSVNRSVVQQRGGLELLLECAGAALEEEGGEVFLVFRENAVSQAELESALRTLEDCQRAVQETRENASQREREEALELMRVEMRRARQQEALQHRRRTTEGPEERLEHPEDDVPHDGGHQPRRRVPMTEAGTDPAKSFLEKLKFGGAAAASVDNNSPPNSEGIIVRLLERTYASEPLSALGLKLSDDGEVVSTEVNSPAAKANIPPSYMIINVNGQFVGGRADFEEIASQHLTLIIKLQTTTAMSELLARMLEEEEKGENGQASAPIDTNELLRTTPRYSFLSAEHPMFLRWNHRIQTQREARQLLRQAARDVEAQQAKEALEKIRQEVEEEELKQRQLEQQRQQEQQEREQLVKPIEVAIPNALPMHENEFHLKRVEDESSFSPFNEFAEITEEANGQTSAEELLKLIGAEPNEAVAAPTVIPEENGGVRFLICPTEEYTLSNGLRVTINVKQRIGPLPKPPPGKPPKGIRALQVHTRSNPVTSAAISNNEKICSFCHLRGHAETECAEKKEQDRTLALNRRERHVCRDYLRGRCTRTECVMRHVSRRSRSTSPRSRKRDRGRNHRSRERRRSGGSRSRRHGSRRRRRRSESSERYRRRR